MKDINEINRKRCIIAFVTCMLIVITTFIGIVTKLFEPYIEGYRMVVGINIFRYFTILSNILINSCAVLCIPFEIDGIRKQNYHLPRWIVDYLYVGVTCMAITFLISLFAAAPYQGFYETFLMGAVFYLHLLCPILSIVLFLFVNVDHNIKADRMLFAVVPLVLYMIVYYINVFMESEDNGGWTDHYHAKELIPSEWLFIALLAVGFVIAFLLRKYHNDLHEKYKNMRNEHYMNLCKENNNDILKVINLIGKEDAKKYKEGSIEIPVHVLKIIKKECNCDTSNEEMYKAYIEAFLEK